jgi:hypothetical protein
MHISNLPEARAQIVDGSFQRFTCPACSHVFRVERTAVYTDFDRGHYLAIEPPAEHAAEAAIAAHEAVFDSSFTYGPAVSEELGWQLTKRVVFGFDAAREKLLLWDAGVDDRAFEAAKIDALADAELIPPGSGPTPWVLRVEQIMDRGHILCRRLEAAWRVLDSRVDGTRIVAMPRTVDWHTVPAATLQARVDAPDTIASDYPWLSHPWLVDATLGAPP